MSYASEKPGLIMRPLRSSADRARRLAHFDGREETWLVSDLRSKLEIQRQLLLKADFARSESVLRAREFWTMLLRRQRPRLQIVSKELLLSTIAEILQTLTEESFQDRATKVRQERSFSDQFISNQFLQTPGAASTVYSYIQQLLPVLTLDHEFGLRAWLAGEFEENPKQQRARQSARTRWGRWFELAELVWKRLLQLRLVAPEWAAAVLSADRFETLRVLDLDPSEELWPRLDLEQVWTKPLVVDLGFAMSQIEGDLLLVWAKSTRVEILIPMLDQGRERDSQVPAQGSSIPALESRSQLHAWSWLLDKAKANGLEPEIVDVDLMDVAFVEAESVDVELGSATSRPAPEEIWRGSFRRFPSASAEVKAAVAKVRNWLDSGVSPAQIALVPTNVEEYWPCLREHAAIEGLPLAKAWMAPAHSRPDVARWLARLRTWAATPDRYDLQVDFFAQTSGPQGQFESPIQFARFQELYRRVYGADDLALDESVRAHYAQLAMRDGEPQPRWTRDEFLVRALHRVPEGVDLSVAARLAKSLLEECPPQIELSPTSWTSYLANMAALVELPIAPAEQGGVQILALSALEGAGCTHVIVMGLHDASLRQPAGTALLESDIRGIESSMGWILDAEDRRRAEREAQWVLTQNYADLDVYFAETNFDGAALTPSWLWLVAVQNLRHTGVECGALELPGSTRFDEIQEARLAVALGAETLPQFSSQADRKFSSSASSADEGPSEFSHKLTLPLPLDLKLQMLRLQEARDENFVHQAFAKGKVTGLTASRLSALSTCPRRFAFDEIFGPDDFGELDFDPDPRRRGNLLHKAFELAGLRGFPEMLQQDVEELLDQARDLLEGRGQEGAATFRGRQLVRDETHWSGLRRRLARSVLRMLQNERERQEKEPKLRPLGFETRFQGELEGIPFRGVIDRIDADVTALTKQGRASSDDLTLRAVVIDYKSSTPAASFKAWVRDKHWQLLVYVLALESGLVDLENLRLSALGDSSSQAGTLQRAHPTKFRAVGAYYHDGKTMKRRGGLRLEDEGSDLFDFSQNSRTKQNRSDLDQALGELRLEISRVAEILREGQFFPLREADTACDSCGWRTACRAPHLKS